MIIVTKAAADSCSGRCSSCRERHATLCAPAASSAPWAHSSSAELRVAVKRPTTGRSRSSWTTRHCATSSTEVDMINRVAATSNDRCGSEAEAHTAPLAGTPPCSSTAAQCAHQHTRSPTGQHHRTESQRLDVGALIGPSSSSRLSLSPGSSVSASRRRLSSSVLGRPRSSTGQAVVAFPRARSTRCPGRRDAEIDDAGEWRFNLPSDAGTGWAGSGCLWRQSAGRLEGHVGAWIRLAGKRSH